MRTILLMLYGIFVLTACQNAPVRREDMIAEHPEWDRSSIEVIRQGYLLKGMTKDQVIAAWGRPCWSCVGTTSGSWGDAWEYATQMVFFDTNGKLTRWQPK